MSRKLKNAHYKSTEQFYTTADIEVGADNIATNPVSLGNVNGLRTVTDTGVAIDDGTILATGTYRLSGDVVLEGITAGVVSIAITQNGTILPETVRSATVDAGATASLHTETVRYFETCCSIKHMMDIILYTDGTAVATDTLFAGNIIKLA